MIYTMHEFNIGYTKLYQQIVERLEKGDESVQIWGYRLSNHNIKVPQLLTFKLRKKSNDIYGATRDTLKFYLQSGKLASSDIYEGGITDLWVLSDNKDELVKHYNNELLIKYKNVKAQMERIAKQLVEIESSFYETDLVTELLLRE